MLLGPWMANMAQTALTFGENHLMARLFGPLSRQMGLDPLDDFQPVAGVDDNDVKRLPEGIVVVAHQHVVEDAALIVGHERVADLAQFHVGHAASEQFSQKNRRAWPFEPQPAHVRNISDCNGISRGGMLFDDRRILHRHGPAGEIDHPCAVGDMPVKKRRSQQIRIHAGGPGNLVPSPSGRGLG